MIVLNPKIFFRLFFCLLILLIVLFIFGYWLNANKLQLLPIAAISVGGAFAIAYYLTDRFYDE